MFHNGSLLARETGKLADFQYKNKEAWEQKGGQKDVAPFWDWRGQSTLENC
jgi:hypothetical protein